MKHLIFSLSALVSGILFGVGMVLSGMTDPAVVIGFLDVFGEWNPSLIFVMGGALAVFMPFYHFVIKPRQAPVVADAFCIASKTSIDMQLVVGAAVFGLGWGLAGICPGPAVSSLALGNVDVLVFFSMMMLGLGGTNRALQYRDNKVMKKAMN
ncbi:YeeE/YedE family protein [Vibrio sp. 03-59-1]|uniref:YeeE/YedE family protein n=1 Tax=Vibrio sp. 03-59-1 TaxID=2607607 RepID=UPI001493D8A8|nr:YeeE/YedE family protein [Vibrio sp. 03-59-1]NOH83807.1 YeeE/YedE family protein [Vibrio sp. 03-59-1]